MNSALQIVTGISVWPVWRLDKTWQHSSKQKNKSTLLKQFQRIKENLQTACTIEYFQQVPIISSHIPFLGVFLTELAIIESEDHDFLENKLINFEKRIKISQVLENFQHCLKHPPSFEEVTQLKSYLLSLSGWTTDHEKTSLSESFLLEEGREVRDHFEGECPEVVKETFLLLQSNKPQDTDLHSQVRAINAEFLRMVPPFSSLKLNSTESNEDSEDATPRSPHHLSQPLFLATPRDPAESPLLGRESPSTILPESSFHALKREGSASLIDPRKGTRNFGPSYNDRRKVWERWILRFRDEVAYFEESGTGRKYSYFHAFLKSRALEYSVQSVLRLRLKEEEKSCFASLFSKCLPQLIHVDEVLEALHFLSSLPFPPKIERMICTVIVSSKGLLEFDPEILRQAGIRKENLRSLIRITSGLKPLLSDESSFKFSRLGSVLDVTEFVSSNEEDSFGSETDEDEYIPLQYPILNFYQEFCASLDAYLTTPANQEFFLSRQVYEENEEEMEESTSKNSPGASNFHPRISTFLTLSPFLDEIIQFLRKNDENDFQSIQTVDIEKLTQALQDSLKAGEEEESKFSQIKKILKMQVGVLTAQLEWTQEQLEKTKEAKRNNKKTDEIIKFLRICNTLSSKTDCLEILSKFAQCYTQQLINLYNFIDHKLVKSLLPFFLLPFSPLSSHFFLFNQGSLFLL